MLLIDPMLYYPRAFNRIVFEQSDTPRWRA